MLLYQKLVQTSCQVRLKFTFTPRTFPPPYVRSCFKFHSEPHCPLQVEKPESYTDYYIILSFPKPNAMQQHSLIPVQIFMCLRVLAFFSKKYFWQTHVFPLVDDLPLFWIYGEVTSGCQGQKWVLPYLLVLWRQM